MALSAKPSPAPDKATVCGLPEALSVTISVPDWLPVEVGEKTTLMVQLAPAASELPQLSVSLNCEVMEMREAPDFEGVSAALPELVKVTVLAALLVMSN